MTRLWPACVLAAALASPGCLRWLYPATSHATEVHHVTTDDGWRLALHRFAPPPGAPARRHPLILCHGVMSNRFNWDLRADGFPLAAARAGFDTWLVELRASGESARPGWLDDLRWDYTFDDYVLRDVPALIAYVRGQAGGARVLWVGHSMGTMVLYGYVERLGGDAVRGAVLVAPPLYVFDHNRRLSARVALLPLASGVLDRLPSGRSVGLAAPWAYPPVIDDERLIWSYDDMRPEVARAAAANAVDDISIRVVEQLAESHGKGRFLSADGAHDYTAALASVEVPLLFVAGALDQLAPPSQALEAHARVGSKDKRIVIFSRANGYSHDYGHVDLVLGEHAAAEVFPELIRWLAARD